MLGIFSHNNNKASDRSVSILIGSAFNTLHTVGDELPVASEPLVLHHELLSFSQVRCTIIKLDETVGNLYVFRVARV